LTENANEQAPLQGEQEVEAEGTVAPKPAEQVPVPDKTKADGSIYDPLVEKADDAEPEDDAAASSSEDGGEEIATYDLVPAQYKELADTYHADAVAIAKDAGIEAGEMEVMLHLALGGAMEAVSKDMGAALQVGQVPGVDLSNKQACVTHLTRKYGATEGQHIIARAQAEFAKLPQSVRDYLDNDSGTGELLTNSPHVLLALAMRNLGWTNMSKDRAEAELERMKGKPLNAFDIEKRRVLGHIVSRGQSGDNKKLTQALETKRASKPTPTAGIEKRIKELRTHPAYFNRDHKSHKEIVQQVSELYAQLGGGAK
jgi:hypothetical protein